MWIRVYQNWKTNFNFKNGRNSSFSYETKASISFILMKTMCLWCPIMKWMEIIMYPNWMANFNSKNGRKRCFSYETKPLISFIPMRRMCLWYLIIKRKEIIMWIHVNPINKQTSILKTTEREVFLMKLKHQ